MPTALGAVSVFDGVHEPVATDVHWRAGRFTSDAPGDGDLDVGGLHVLPGLIDAHTHLGLLHMDAAGDVPPAVLAAEVFLNCRLALDAGFTTVRDVGGLDGGVARAVADGLVPGPRILPSGAALTQTGGHTDHGSRWAGEGHGHGSGHGVPGLVTPGAVADGVAEVRRAARTAFKRGATQLKVCVTGGVASYTDRLEDRQYSVEELRAAVDEARARHSYVTAHAHNTEGIRVGLEAGVSCFEHVSFLDEETAALLAQAEAAVVPTLSICTLFVENWQQWNIPADFVPRMQGVYEAAARATRLAADAGLLIGSGSDLLGPTQTRRGLEIAVKADVLGAHRALVSATSDNARVLRLEGEVGRVAAGCRADWIAVDGDPFADPRVLDDPDRVVVVVQQGQVVKDRR